MAIDPHAFGQGQVAQLAALGTQTFTDDAGLAWKLKVSAASVATISRTTATARFLVGGRVIVATWP